MEARFIQTQLEARCGRSVFLDSDDLRYLRDLPTHVGSSDVLVVLQSKTLLSRPFCLLELHAAISRRVPIVAVCLAGPNGYDFDEGGEFMRHLDTRLDAEAASVLAQHGVTDLRRLAHELETTLPKVSSRRCTGT